MSLRRLNDNFRYTNLSAYRDQITLLAPAAPTSALPDGSPGTPVVFASGVWAAIRLMQQKEVDYSQIVEAEAWYDVRIPYIPGVSSQMTVVSPSAKTWKIASVADLDQRQRELKIVCYSVNDGG
jgi:hypothetical protein